MFMFLVHVFDLKLIIKLKTIVTAEAMAALTDTDRPKRLSGIPSGQSGFDYSGYSNEIENRKKCRDISIRSNYGAIAQRTTIYGSNTMLTEIMEMFGK